jgi:hypothetical protein
LLEILKTAVCALLLLGFMPGALGASEPEVRYGLGSWSGDLGNHQAWVRVAEQCDAVLARIPWRRRDEVPEQKGIIVTDAFGNRVRNVYRARVERDVGEVIFQPDQPGDYYIYYMPYTADPVPWAYSVTYTPEQNSADPGWLARHSLTQAEQAWHDLPKAEVLEIQARSEFDRFDPMEVIATQQEVAALPAQYTGRSYIVFPEDRRFPIRMTRDFPLRWIQSGRRNEFEGEACRGEFYVFQLGVYPLSKKLEDVAVAFTDLRSAEGKVIPSSAFRCFNAGGTDWLGQAMKKTLNMESGVYALWLGVQVPGEASPGRYRGEITLRPGNAEEYKIGFLLQVSGKVLDDAGDSDLRRLSRLRWLDSTIGLDDEVVAPYTPMKVRGQTVGCLGREVKRADTGLPRSIRSGGREILARPMAFVVETADGIVKWTGGKAEILSARPGSVTWQSESAAGDLKLTCRAKMEFDGYTNFRVSLAAAGPVGVKDIRLEIPIRREIATYMMGLGCEGGYRPAKWEWVWDIDRCNNAVWIGDVNAGLQCKLKGTEDTWDIYGLRTSGIPGSWGNNGRGGCTITEERDSVLVRAYSGERALKAGEELEFRFGLLITPVKPLDPAHWNQRYYHDYVPPETAVQSGANIINIHHGNELNPYINYPFLTADKLRAYVEQAHEKGVKVKIYYTVRELSNHVAELWALRSLGTEVFTDGPGGGNSWLREHLVDHYAPAWHHVFPDGEVDAAIATTGLSRWHNYYLEGLAWLLKNVEIDGLYLDGIGYDREIMKRVRKVMDRARTGCLIDFHSGNEFPFHDLRISPANKYMEHFPYINSLWFGEGYDYNRSPDYWLVEVSGIPFGLFGEMLQDNGNPWRGMIYGMTARYYSGADPKHIWKLWDEFGIQDAKMIGYWSPNCPVRTDNKDVLATAYSKKDKVLISIASWAKESFRVRLTIDWNALGLDPATCRLAAPTIPGFQDAASFSPHDEIPVQPGKGWLLILEGRSMQLRETREIGTSYTWRKVTGAAG